MTTVTGILVNHKGTKLKKNCKMLYFWTRLLPNTAVIPSTGGLYHDHSAISYPIFTKSDIHNLKIGSIYVTSLREPANLEYLISQRWLWKCLSLNCIQQTVGNPYFIERISHASAKTCNWNDNLTRDKYTLFCILLGANYLQIILVLLGLFNDAVG